MKIKKRETAIMSIDEFNELIGKTEYCVYCDQDGWDFGIITDDTEIKEPVGDLVEKVMQKRNLDASEEDIAIEVVLLNYISQKIIGEYIELYIDEESDTVILLGE